MTDPNVILECIHADISETLHEEISKLVVEEAEKVFKEYESEVRALIHDIIHLVMDDLRGEPKPEIDVAAE
jgi:hypothetical protein